jgi:hypothetical protein
MDGITLLRELEQLLREIPSLAVWPNVKQAYDYLYQAAVATADKSGILTTTQTITTVADQANYRINPDFLRLYLTDNKGKFYIKYNDGTNDYFIYNTSMDAITLANQTTSVTIPSSFSIQRRALDSAITGTTTGEDYSYFTSTSYTVFGQTLGETELTDSGGGLTNVKVGDIVHNKSFPGVASGYVVATTSSSEVICALFGDMDNMFFRSGDSYAINPQSCFELYLSPPPSTASHTITLYYVEKPDPIYSAYRMYPFPSGYSQVLVQYAAWLVKYRDKEPNMGDAFYKYWDANVRSLTHSVSNAKQTKGYRVNLIKSATRSWGYK